MSQTNDKNIKGPRKASEARPVWRVNGGQAHSCDWLAVDPAILQRCVAAVTASGGAIMFGRTSDGGAFSLVVLRGNEKIKEYPHTAEACHEMLDAIAEYVREDET